MVYITTIVTQFITLLKKLLIIHSKYLIKINGNTITHIKNNIQLTDNLEIPRAIINANINIGINAISIFIYSLKRHLNPPSIF